MNKLGVYVPVILAFMLAILGVSLLVFYSNENEIPVNISIGVVLVTVICYFLWILHKDKPSDSDIDSVYYLGFVITVLTLVFTIFHIADDKDIAKHSAQVIFQFGAGLAFTAVALICRMILLLKEEARKRPGAEADAESLDQKTARLGSHFDALSINISNLAINAQTRSDSLLAAFDATEAHFKDRLNRTAGLFGQHAQASEARLKQAENELEAAVKQAQAREKRLEMEFSQAVTKFNGHLAQAAKDSVDKTAAVIGQSTQAFAGSVAGLGDEVGRLQKDVKTLNFNAAAKRFEAFANAMETSLGSVQAAVDTASQNAADAIGTLAAAAQDTHALAVKIAANLDSLENLDRLVAQIANAGEGLDGLSRRAAQSGDSLDGLGGAAQGAAAASAQLSHNADAASASLTQAAAASQDAINAIAKLAGAAKDAHALALRVAESLDGLQNIETLVAQIGQAAQGLEKVSAGAAQSGDALLGLDGRAREAAIATGQLRENLQGAAHSLAQVKTANHDAAEAVAKLADAAKKTHNLALAIAENMNKPKFPPHL